MGREVRIGEARRRRSAAERRRYDAQSLDLTGQVYGDLTVVGFAGYRRKASGKLIRVWECRCKCTRKKLVPVEDLRSGNTRSCGRDCRLRRVARSADRERELDEYAAGLDPGFWRSFSELLTGRGLDVAVLRLRWPGPKPAFVDIFEKRRRVPTAEEAETISDMLVLRGFDRDGFTRLCFEARLARERAVERWERTARFGAAAAGVSVSDRGSPAAGD